MYNIIHIKVYRSTFAWVSLFIGDIQASKGIHMISKAINMYKHVSIYSHCNRYEHLCNVVIYILSEMHNTIVLCISDTIN